MPALSKPWLEEHPSGPVAMFEAGIRLLITLLVGVVIAFVTARWLSFEWATLATIVAIAVVFRLLVVPFWNRYVE